MRIPTSPPRRQVVAWPTSKFRMNAGRRLDAFRLRRVLDIVWAIDERPDLTGLLASL